MIWLKAGTRHNELKRFSPIGIYSTPEILQFVMEHHCFGRKSIKSLNIFLHLKRKIFKHDVIVI